MIFPLWQTVPCYKDKQESKAVLEYGYTGTRLNQLYLAFPDDVYIQTRPNYLSTNVEEQEDEIKIKFAVNDNKYRDAFVYTGGKLSGIYSNLKRSYQGRQARWWSSCKLSSDVSVGERCCTELWKRI